MSTMEGRGGWGPLKATPRVRSAWSVRLTARRAEKQACGVIATRHYTAICDIPYNSAPNITESPLESLAYAALRRRKEPPPHLVSSGAALGHPFPGPTPLPTAPLRSVIRTFPTKLPHSSQPQPMAAGQRRIGASVTSGLDVVVIARFTEVDFVGILKDPERCLTDAAFPGL